MIETELTNDINMPLLGQCESNLALTPDAKREHFLYVIHVLQGLLRV